MPKQFEELGRGPESPSVLGESGSKLLKPGAALAKAFLKDRMSKRKGEVNRDGDILKPKSDNAQGMREKEVMQGKGEDVQGTSFTKTKLSRPKKDLNRMGSKEAYSGGY